MLEKYNMERTKVEQLLEKLVRDGKIHMSGQDDSANYYIPTMAVSKKSRKSDGSGYTEVQRKEIASWLAKCIKELNMVTDKFILSLCYFPLGYRRMYGRHRIDVIGYIVVKLAYGWWSTRPT